MYPLPPYPRRRKPAAAPPKVPPEPAYDPPDARFGSGEMTAPRPAEPPPKQPRPFLVEPPEWLAHPEQFIPAASRNIPAPEPARVPPGPKYDPPGPEGPPVKWEPLRYEAFPAPNWEEEEAERRVRDEAEKQRLAAERRRELLEELLAEAELGNGPYPARKRPA